MKITVLNGTAVRGITYHFKEYFLALFDDCEITQFYPSDYPAFCVGCKNCILKSETLCPHADKISPIWQSILDSDLIVAAYPVYAMRAPGSIKTLLDHFCVHWMVHRPEEKMFHKKAVLLTNSVGIALQQKSAQKDAATSLSWLGISEIYSAGAGMMGDIFWDNISAKHKKMLKEKARKVFRKARVHRAKRMGAVVKCKFFLSKRLHAAVLKSEVIPSADNAHYLDKGWIRDTRKHGTKNL